MDSLRHTRGLLAGLVAVLALALPSGASAFPGEVEVADCISGPGLGCAEPEGGWLSNVYGLAVRPNGNDLYTATTLDGVITQYDIGSDGELSFGSCLGENGFSCADFPFEEPVDGFSFGQALVVPEGDSLYLLGTGQPDRVWDFDLSVAGVATVDDCIDGFVDSPTCSTFQAGIVNPQGMAISGSDLYVTGHEGASFFRLARGESPSFAHEYCIGEAPACNNIEHASYYGPTGIAADGDDVYVTAGQGTSGEGNWRRAVTHFEPNSEDILLPKECFAKNDGDCEKVPAFNDPGDIVLSGDGKSVYVVSGDPAGEGVGSLSRFNRKDNGKLSFADCFASEDGGCKAPPHAGALAGARSLVITKDGSSVYVGGRAAIVEFTRSPSGKLEFAGCLASEGEFGCNDAGTGALGVVRRLAIAPNDTDLYATGLDAVIHLEREIPECEDEPATAFGTNGKDTFDGSAEEDVIVALGGDDEANGSDGDDVLCGGKGNDVLKGGPGEDTCIGGPGKDKAPGCETRRSI